MENLLGTCIEISSLLDLISDVNILYYLYNSSHTAWLTMTLFAILCPIFTTYTSLMNFKIADLRRKLSKNSLSFCDYINIMISVMPTMLFILIFLELIYTIISLIVFPILILIKVMSCNKYDYQKPYKNFLNTLFLDIYKLSFQDMQGLRKQKTIL